VVVDSPQDQTPEQRRADFDRALANRKLPRPIVGRRAVVQALRQNPKLDLTGKACCLACGATATHKDGPGTPLVIRHSADCPNRPTALTASLKAGAKAMQHEGLMDRIGGDW
jgi:hypothetical protein